MNELNHLHRMMWGRVESICDANAAIILPQTDINDIIVDFKADLPKWDALESRYIQSQSPGSAVQKHLFWDTAATNISRWGIRLHVQAHKDGLFTVEALINKSKSELMQGQALEAYHSMVALKDSMKDNATHFTVQKFTPLVVTALEKDLSNFKDEINAPQLESKESIEIRNQLDDLYGTIETKVSDFVSLLESEFAVSQPEMVNNLMLAHIIGKSTSHRYSGVDGSGTKNGLPLIGYTVTIDRVPPKVAKLDLLGAYSIKSVKPGLVVIILKDANGIEVERRTVKMMKGTMITINWEL